MPRWTEKAVLELIYAYKRNSLLWNKDHRKFFCRESRRNAWAEMAEIFEIDPEMVKRKIKRLVTTYRQQLHVIMKTTRKHGSATYSSTWFAYKALNSFLYRKYTKTSTAECDTQDSLDATTDNDEEQIIDNDEVQIIDDDEVEQVYKIDDSSEDESHPNEDVLTVPNHTIKQEPNTDGSPLPRSQEMDHCEPSIKRPKLAETTSQSRSRTYADVRKKDDCDLFGKYLSGTMREFDRRTRCVVQYLVSNILCQADLGAFQDGNFDCQSFVRFQPFNTKSNEDAN